MPPLPTANPARWPCIATVFLVLVLCGPWGGCCQTSTCVLTGALPDAAFAPATPELMMYCGLYGGDGLCRVALDGSAITPLFDPAYSVLDMTDDGTRVLLGDQDTNLFIASSEGTDLHQIHELDGRTGSAAFSPDGSTVAAVRHADFSLPQRSWVDDDAVYLVDVATRQVQILPKSANVLVTYLSWEASGQAVQLRLFSNQVERVSIPGGVRTSPPPTPTPLRGQPNGAHPRTCPATGDQVVTRGYSGDEGLDIVTAAGHTTPLIDITGCGRPCGDCPDTLSSYYFTPDCGHVVFDFEESVWVVDVATGQVGPITQGRTSFVWPSIPPANTPP